MSKHNVPVHLDLEVAFGAAFASPRLHQSAASSFSGHLKKHSTRLTPVCSTPNILNILHVMCEVSGHQTVAPVVRAISSLSQQSVITKPSYSSSSFFLFSLLFDLQISFFALCFGYTAYVLMLLFFYLLLMKNVGLKKIIQKTWAPDFTNTHPGKKGTACATVDVLHAVPIIQNMGT